MHNSAWSVRRWLGAGCLGIAAGMLVGGQTWFQSQLKGVGFVLYWCLCFALTFAALVIAYLDTRAIRRRAVHEQQALLQQAVEEIDPAKNQQGKPPRFQNRDSGP